MPEVSRKTIEESVGVPMPTMKDVRSMLRRNPFGSTREKVLEAFVVGSIAKGTNTKDSDLDIAVIIPAKKRVSAYRFTDRYHQKFFRDSEKPHWNGLRVDFQFFYYPSELSEFHRMDCSK